MFTYIYGSEIPGQYSMMEWMFCHVTQESCVLCVIGPSVSAFVFNGCWFLKSFCPFLYSHDGVNFDGSQRLRVICRQQYNRLYNLQPNTNRHLLLLIALQTPQSILEQRLSNTFISIVIAFGRGRNSRWFA